MAQAGALPRDTGFGNAIMALTTHDKGNTVTRSTEVAMSVSSLRRHNASRAIVGCLLVVVLCFGGSFLPVTPTERFLPREPTRILVGSEASRYVSQLAKRQTSRSKSAKATAVNVRNLVPTENQVVVVTSSSRPEPTGFVGWAASKYYAWADVINEYTDGGVMVITPFDAGDQNIAGFSVYYEDFDSGLAQGGDARIDTSEAAYGSLDNAIAVSDAYLYCSLEPGYTSWPSFAWFALRALAQNAWRGHDCDAEKPCTANGVEWRDQGGPQEWFGSSGRGSFWMYWC